MSADPHIRVLTHTADTISAVAILGYFAGVVPVLAAFAAFIWYCVQLWESHTVQKWWRLHRKGRRTTWKRIPRRYRKRKEQPLNFV